MSAKKSAPPPLKSAGSSKALAPATGLKKAVSSSKIAKPGEKADKPAPSLSRSSSSSKISAKADPKPKEAVRDSPPDSAALVLSKLRSALSGSEDKLSTFKKSIDFAAGKLSPMQYYDECLTLVGEGEKDIIAEIATTLPNEQRKRELLSYIATLEQSASKDAATLYKELQQKNIALAEKARRLAELEQELQNTEKSYNELDKEFSHYRSTHVERDPDFDEDDLQELAFIVGAVQSQRVQSYINMLINKKKLVKSEDEADAEGTAKKEKADKLQFAELAFMKYDKEKTGFITSAEFVLVAKELGMEFDQQMAKLTISTLINKNHGDKIGKKEFVEWTANLKKNKK